MNKKIIFMLSLGLIIIVFILFVGLTKSNTYPLCLADSHCNSKICWEFGNPYSKCTSKLFKNSEQQCQSRTESKNIDCDGLNFIECMEITLNDPYGEMYLEPEKCECKMFRCKRIYFTGNF